MSNILAVQPFRHHAQAYADRGVAVFPLKRHGKAPAVKDGFRAATTDAHQIARWCAVPRVAAGNLGMPTGSGLVVIDVDPRHGGTVDPDWPTTRTVQTASGGWHLYYRTTETVPCSASRVAQGVDVRGDGGYVVLPPSLTADGSWSWVDPSAPLADLPADLLGKALCRGGARSPNGAADSQTFVCRDRVGSGERNDYLARFAGWLYSDGYDDNEVVQFMHLENDTSCVPPVDSDEVEQIAASIGRYHR